MSEKDFQIKKIDSGVCNYITEGLRVSIELIDRSIEEIEVAIDHLQKMKDSFTEMPEFPKGNNIDATQGNKNK